MEWSHLKVLLALERGGSIAGAARDLRIDHSTVSRQLAALEEAVGAQLVIRASSGLTWTPQGTRLLKAAAAMDSAATEAMRDVRGDAAEMRGIVRLSVPTGYLPILIRLLLPRLELDHPNLKVELDGTYQQVDLGRGGADIAVRMSRPTEPDLVARRAFGEAWFAYASNEYGARRGLPGTPENLARHDLVLFAERLHSLEPLGWMEPYCGEKAARVRVDSIEAAAQIVSAGGGIAVLPAFVAHASPSLSKALPEPVATKIGWIVYHEALRNSARTRAVANMLARVFQEQKAVFMGVDDTASTP